MSVNNNDEHNIKNQNNDSDYSYHWNYDDYQSTNMIPTPPPKKKKDNKKLLKILAGLMSLVLVISLTSLITLLATGNSPLVQDNLAATDPAGKQDTTDIQKVSIKSEVDPNAEVLSTVDVIKKAKPSVVAIQVTVEQQVFGRVYEGVSVGTGFIISEDGYIVTNNHVVEGGKKITVSLGTGEEYEAQLVGGDELSDLAVIKIEAKELPAMTLGDSDALEEGEDVVAIGTPGGIEFAGTTTKGIVSAIGREIEVSVSSDPYSTSATKKMTVIQTDASINSGNSGGPLVNNKGQVIGINTMKLSSGYEGMGFAIPINGAIPIINGLIENGEITEYGDDTFVQGTAVLGISGTDITSDISKQKNIPMGVKIEQISSTELTNAGVQLGDIIIKYNGDKVESIESLKSLISGSKVGQIITLTVYRNGDELDFQVKLVYAR